MHYDCWNATGKIGLGIGAVREDFHLVAVLDVTTFDRSYGQFDYRGDLPTDAAQSPRAKVGPDRIDAMLAIERDDIDGEEHAEGVHAGGWLNEQACPGFEVTTAKQAHQPSQKCVGHGNSFSNQGGTRFVVNRYLFHIGGPAVVNA